MINWRVTSIVVVLGALVLALAAMPPGARAAGQAEIALSGPSGTQTTATPFDVTVSITRANVRWAGYNAQIAYDTSVLQVKDVARLPLAACNDTSWANPYNTPTVLVACVFQDSTDTGPVDKITFQCLKDGSSELHLVTMTEDTIQGTTMLDENAIIIPTDLKDGPTVTCGAGGPLATVAIPTNPPQSAVDTAVAAGAPTPHPGASESSGSPVAGATGGAANGGGTAASGTAAGPGASASAGPAATRAAATSAASASKTSTANATQTSSDSGMPAWLIALIVVVVLAAAGVAGWLVLKRRGGASGV
jgi:hypothetical protein